jgi:diacylglycerol kinase (ATP)
VLAREYRVETLVPHDASDATRLAREAARRGADIVIAAGGDGTINIVAAGLDGTGVPLGILPLGTANDLARELGIPRALDAAAQRIIDGTPRPTDMGEVNGRTFCTVGGTTLVAESALLVTRLKTGAPWLRHAANLLSGGIYRLTATANLLGRWSLTRHLSIAYVDADTRERRNLELDAHALFVTNHRTLGGGLTLPVNASAQDGAMELILVGRRSRLSLIANFARLSAGKPLPTGVLTVVRASSAVVQTDAEDAFVADGELLARGREFRLAVRAGALRVIV